LGLLEEAMDEDGTGGIEGRTNALVIDITGAASSAVACRIAMS
jgi:hypothetical protein